MESMHHALCCVAGATGVFASSVSAQANDWQLQQLTQPSAAQLAAEQRGGVFIYDGLDAGLVADAMESHFERIQNMMFIRIHHLPPSGAGGDVEVEDDGCD